MLVTGVPLEVVADILGHSCNGITADIYGDRADIRWRCCHCCLELDDLRGQT